MTSKEDILNIQFQIAGYHNDMAEFVRLYCENRVSKDRADRMFELGQKKRYDGHKCTCYLCKREV